MPDLDFDGDIGLHVISQSLNAIAAQSGVRVEQMVTTATTTSTSYADLSDESNDFDVAFAKHFSSTALRIDMGMIINNTLNVIAVCGMGVNIGGTDYEISKLSHVGTNDATGISGIRLITGITAGSYVIKPRWRRISGTGSLFRVPETPLWMAVREVRG